MSRDAFEAREQAAYEFHSEVDMPGEPELRCWECDGPADDRVRAGMKCGPCAYGQGEVEEDAHGATPIDPLDSLLEKCWQNERERLQRKAELRSVLDEILGVSFITERRRP